MQSCVVARKVRIPSRITITGSNFTPSQQATATRAATHNIISLARLIFVVVRSASSADRRIEQLHVPDQHQEGFLTPARRRRARYSRISTLKPRICRGHAFGQRRDSPDSRQAGPNIWDEEPRAPLISVSCTSSPNKLPHLLSTFVSKVGVVETWACALCTHYTLWAVATQNVLGDPTKLLSTWSILHLRPHVTFHYCAPRVVCGLDGDIKTKQK